MKPIHYAVAHRSQEEIDSFQTRYQDFNPKYLREILQTMGFTVIDYREPTSKGASHVIYIVEVEEHPRPLIFRANLGFNKHPEMTMKIEALVTERVRTIGVPTNNILKVDVTRAKYPFDYQVEEMLPGHDLETEFTGTQQDYDALSFELGTMVAKIHSIKLPGFGMFDEGQARHDNLVGSAPTLYDYVVTCLDEDVAHIQQAGLISADSTRAIVKVFEDRKDLISIPQGVLVHYDLADHNIMYEGRHITGIFDWEACVVGDPVIDLASCPTWKTHYPRLEKLLAGYQSVSPLPDNFDEKMKLYTLRTALWKTVINIRRGNEVTGEKLDRLINALEKFNV